jgi:hypothetical protein
MPESDLEMGGRRLLALMIVPSQIIAASFVAGVSVPFFLVMVSRGPLRVDNFRNRFGFASALAVSLWLAIILMGSEVWRLDGKAIGDVLAGALIIVSAMLTTLIVWLLVATGVSVNLLVSLAAKPEPVDVDSWLANYGDGFGIDDLFRDRLNLLCSTGAATIDRSVVCLARGSRVPAAILDAAMLYFNFQRPAIR